MKLALLAIFLALPLAAQAPKPSAPTIPDAQKLKYFKAKAQFEQAQAMLQDAAADIAKTCGSEFQPFLDPSGDLVCREKGQEAKKT